MSGKPIPMKVLLAAIVVSGGVAPGETIALQQGAGGYAGCTTKMHRGAPDKTASPPTQLPLRGARNKLEIRFERPKDIPAEKLPQVRLGRAETAAVATVRHTVGPLGADHLYHYSAPRARIGHGFTRSAGYNHLRNDSPTRRRTR